MHTSSPSRPRIWPWLAWALLILVLDQLTKQWILRHYALWDSTPVTSFFNIVRAHNTGAAFSFLADHGGWQRWLFVGIGVGATVLITWQLRKYPTQKLFCFALASILGGAIGNVIDRLRFGAVVDFIQVHAGSHYWPAFNVADSCIFVAAIIFFIASIFSARNKEEKTS